MSQPIHPKLDRLDLKILAALNRNARMTKTQMSDEVGLSATRCTERMQRLERASIIRGYHADIDLRLLARLSFFIVQVSLFDTTPARMRQFEQLVARVDVVISCQAVLGTVDYVMVVVASSTESFQTIMDDISQREGVKFEYVTFPVARHVKSAHGISLLSLLSQVEV
ncbi:MAG TPA: Lrp/AsnC family transcriptional regulator [Steroidobacteraceae bacterium]|nr:Lrp/AsnC family transcriptional regulator [Steroidobacteraceae bacterium]